MSGDVRGVMRDGRFESIGRTEWGASAIRGLNAMRADGRLTDQEYRNTVAYVRAEYGTCEELER